MIATLREDMGLIFRKREGAPLAQVVRCSKVGAKELLRQPLQYLDAAFDGAELALREAADASDEAAGRGATLIEERPALLGQAEREAAAIGRVGRAVDVARLDEPLDRAAGGRSAAPGGLGDLAECRRLMLGDGGQQGAGGAVGTFGEAVVVERFEQCRKTRGDGGGG